MDTVQAQSTHKKCAVQRNVECYKCVFMYFVDVVQVAQTELMKLASLHSSSRAGMSASKSAAGAVQQSDDADAERHQVMNLMPTFSTQSRAAHSDRSHHHAHSLSTTTLDVHPHSGDERGPAGPHSNLHFSMRHLLTHYSSLPIALCVIVLLIVITSTLHMHMSIAWPKLVSYCGLC